MSICICQNLTIVYLRFYFIVYKLCLKIRNYMNYCRTLMICSLQSKELSRVFSNTTVQNHQFFGAQLSFIVQLSHSYMTPRKSRALTRQTFVGKVTSLLLNMLSRLVIAFLPRSKCLLISWLSPSAVILEPKKIKFVTVSIVFPSIHHEVILVF